MKLPPKQTLLSLITTSCLLAQGAQPGSAIAAPEPIRLPVADWTCMGDKEKYFGPTESSDAMTFSGEGLGGRSIVAFFPETTLTEGKSLTVTARVTFSGVFYFGSFKFGLFQSASRTKNDGALFI